MHPWLPAVLQTSFADVEVHSTEEEEDCGGNEDGLEEIRLEAVLLVAVGASTNKATWQQRKVA